MPTTRASQFFRYESSRNRQSVGIAIMPSGFLERRLDVRFALEPFRYRKFLRAQEVRVEQLRLIARAEVGKNGHDGVAGSEILRQPDCTGDVDAARAAEAKAFVQQQVEDDRNGFFVRDEIGFVDLHLLDD